MHFASSPAPSPSTSPSGSSAQPIAIRKMASPTDSLYGSFSDRPSSAPQAAGSSPCAYPSWPTGNQLCARPGSGSAFDRDLTPSSFISDEDLLSDDEVCCFLTEAPAPPRQLPYSMALPQVQACPILPPLYASEKPGKKRRRSSKKQRRPSKPMTPIAESPETPE